MAQKWIWVHYFPEKFTTLQFFSKKMDPNPTNRRSYVNCQEYRVAPKTRVEYLNKGSRFILYIAETFPNLLNISRDVLGDKGSIKTWVKLTQSPCPTKLEDLTSEIIITYLCGLKKKNGEPVGWSVCNTTRSSIRYLFILYRVRMSEELTESLTGDFVGLRRIIATEEQNGEIAVRSAISIPEQTLNNRQRRKPQLSWTYVVQIVESKSIHKCLLHHQFLNHL